MTATVSTLNTVNLTTYTANKSLAGSYNFFVTTTPIYPAVPLAILPNGYTYPTTSASHAVSLVVVDPCTRTTISAQTIPTLTQFVGSSTTSQQSFIFQDLVSAVAQLQSVTNYCGTMDWTFSIDGLNTFELTGNNVQGTITFSPPLTINPATRNANLKASLTSYPTKFVDNPFQVVATECQPAFTLTSQPEQVNYGIVSVSTTYQTMNAIRFTDSNGCGKVLNYMCKISGLACPDWITINASQKMTINTNNLDNVGLYTVNIETNYVDSLGATVALPPTQWILNVQCQPAFTLTSQPESPVDYTVNPFSTHFTTTAAIQFTDSSNCGFLLHFSCMMGGIACPSWIWIDASKKMTVYTNSQLNIGQKSVIIKASYVQQLGTTISLPDTPWVLNVKECIPTFTITNWPESPVNYLVQPVSTTYTTPTAIQFVDANNCGIVPTFSCELNGILCPLWITIDASNKMTVNTNDPANIGRKSVYIKASFFSQLGTTVSLPDTSWVLNVNECIPVFTKTNQPESPVEYIVLPVSTTYTSPTAIQFFDANNCGIVPNFSCKVGGISYSWITISGSNKMTVNTNNRANIGQYTVTIEASYVSQLGTTVTLPSLQVMVVLTVLGIPTGQAKPKTLLNSNESVKITWQAPLSDGGSPITGYSVAFRQSDGTTYTIESNCNVITTTCTIPLSALFAAPYYLSWGTGIYAVVHASNLAGFTTSAPSDGEIMITYPDPPTNFLVDQKTMLFTWDRGDFDGGTPVINYRILWDQGNSTYTVLKDGISRYSSIAQITTQPSTVYKFKAQTRNQFGWSGYSNEISFKTAGAFTLRIRSMIFNVIINEQASLKLPVADGIQYTVLSSHTFQVSVQGSDLNVLSKNERDKGKTQTVKMSATCNNQTVTFSVFLRFKIQTPAKTPTKTPAKTPVKTPPKTPTKTPADSTKTSQEQAITEATTALATAADVTVDSLDCSTDDQLVTLCVTANGQFCYMDVALEKMICSAIDPTKKTQQNVLAIDEKNPTASVSKITSMGKFSINFSEAMNFDGFMPKANLPRRLRGAKSGGRSSLKISGVEDVQSSSQNSQKTKYMLSEEHLMIKIIPGPEFNSTLLNFDWEVLEITESDIEIQILFDYPLSVSTGADQLEKISIEFQWAALNYLTAKGSGLPLINPLQRHVKFVPPQMYVGAVTQGVEKAAGTMETVSQTTVIGTVIMQLVLSQALSLMWIMVNALQIIIAMQSLNIIKPGNVSLVLNNLASLASFDLIQSATIIEASFSFSETDSPGIGFESMGSTNKRLIPYLGMAYLILLFVCGQYCFLYLAYHLKDKYTLAKKYYERFRKSLIWTQALLYMLESCLDIYTGVLLSLEQPMWLTSSDQCDLVFTIILAPLGLAFPFFCYGFLMKNISQLQEKQFEEKYGSLYEMWTVSTDLKRQNAIKATSWFVLRRLLTAISIVPLRKQTVWIQLVCTMYLTLTDVCFKIHLNPYRTRIVGTLEKLNDMIVLVLSYFNFLFTDLIPDPVDRYFIGWCYVGTVAILVTSNLSVMITTGIRGLMESIKEKVAQFKQWWTKQQTPHHKKELKIQSPRPIHGTEEETESQKLRRLMIRRQADSLSEIQEESSQQSEQQSPRSPRKRIQTQLDTTTQQQRREEIILRREQKARKDQETIDHYRMVREKAASVKKFPITFPEQSPYYQPPQNPYSKSQEIISVTNQVDFNCLTPQTNVKPNFKDELLPHLARRLARQQHHQQRKKDEITSRSPYKNKKLTLDSRQAQFNMDGISEAKLQLTQEFDMIESE